MNITSTRRDHSLKDILPVIKIFWKKKEGEIRQEMTKNKIMNMISTSQDDNEYNMIMKNDADNEYNLHQVGS